MWRAAGLAFLMVAIALAACSEKSPAGAGAGGSGGGATGTGGSGGGASGGQGGAGGGQGGAGGVAGACAEPAPCDGYDNRPDAGVTAQITCLSPSVTPANAPLTLTIYGHHLATGPNDYAIVTVGSPALALNGIPQSACHLTVQVPASEVAAAGPAAVVVDPGGWVRFSAPATLTVE
jgi:hypothetical protein